MKPGPSVKNQTDLIRPLTIGQQTFASNLIVGPLAGFSCAPMRVLAWQVGRPGYCCTEMISAQHWVNSGDQAKRYRWIDPREGPVCFQLSADDPDCLARACEYAVQAGAALIDLNCGCPKEKMRRKGVGSRLLAEEKRLYALVRAMKQAVDVPVTVKIRTDNQSMDGYNDAVLSAVVTGGADAVVVHPRHWREDYTCEANWQELALIKAQSPIPVIANGDVHDYASLQACLQVTGCDGYMVSRASMGQPWLTQHWWLQSQGLTVTSPSLAEVGALLQQHLQDLIQLVGEVPAMLQARRICRYYGKPVILDPVYFDDIKHLTIATDAWNLIKHYYLAGDIV